MADPRGAAALHWIIGLLDEQQIPYQIVGGLAARAYGARRPLADIDIYVPDEGALDAIGSAAEGHLVATPRRHRDAHWDLTFLELRPHGWTVELAAASSARVWDRRVQTWRPAEIRFELGEERTAAGVDLLVMPRRQLVDYKNGLGRAVDLVDLVELGEISHPIRIGSKVERKSPELPRFVTVPEERAAHLGLTRTAMVEISVDGRDIGRRSLKPWGGERDVWFFELTRDHADAGDWDTADVVALEIRRADESLPAEAYTLLHHRTDAAETWAALTPSRRRMIAEDVRSAKRAATRERRARKHLLGG
ncbi:MAG: YdeI/OmpD-associated family protein [Longimicrobiales bacterium]|nr:YdeI/OmpD-associated family protein [Longimicrobiales bacterium]